LEKSISMFGRKENNNILRNKIIHRNNLEVLTQLTNVEIEMLDVMTWVRTRDLTIV